MLQRTVSVKVWGTVLHHRRWICLVSNETRWFGAQWVLEWTSLQWSCLQRLLRPASVFFCIKKLRSQPPPQAFGMTKATASDSPSSFSSRQWKKGRNGDVLHLTKVLLKSGYSNLMDHVKTNHQNQISDCLELSKMRTSDMMSTVTYPLKRHCVHAWI